MRSSRTGSAASTGSFSNLLSSAFLGAQAQAIEQLVSLMAEIMTNKLEADSASVWFVSDDRLRLGVVVNGLSPHQMLGSTISCDDTSAGAIMKTLQPTIVADIPADDRFRRPDLIRQASYRSLAGCPIFVGTTCIGVVNVLSRTPKKFAESDVIALSCLSDILGLAIHDCNRSIDAFSQWVRVFRSLHANALDRPSSDQRETERAAEVSLLSLTPPKGISLPTLNKVQQELKRSHPACPKEVASAVGLSLVSARKYLNYMHGLGLVDRQVVYGKVGRPSYLYYSRTPRSLR